MTGKHSKKIKVESVEEGESPSHPFQEQIEKTQFCRYFPSGKCTKGSDCGFAHSTRDLRKVPDLTKTSFCKLFKKGECPKSKEDCPFAHGVHDLRTTPMFQAKRADKTYKSKPKSTPVKARVSQLNGPGTPGYRGPELASGAAYLATSLPDVDLKQERACEEASAPQWHHAYPGQDSSVPIVMPSPAMYAQFMPMVFVVAPASPSTCSSHHDYVGKMLKQAMPEYYED